MKRLFDVAVALVVLLIASPVMVVLAIAIKLTSPGPAIFSQTRVGKNEAPFQCLKFRTMRTGTPNVASHNAARSWITPVGAFLRRSKLDELPQLINILRGEMSMVGPRPCLPHQEELLNERRNRGVFDVLPGITGSAQLAGIDMSTPQRLAIADAEYIANRSFSGDFAIIVKTALGKGTGDAV